MRFCIRQKHICSFLTHIYDCNKTLFGDNGTMCFSCVVSSELRIFLFAMLRNLYTGDLKMGAEVTRVGIKRQVDKLGRIVIPKEYREFYHLDHNDEVFIVDTTEGLLITNYNYKVVKVDNKKSAQ